jgi:hypothetical protein
MPEWEPISDTGTSDADRGVLEAARAIRPFLRGLVDSPAVAASLDQRLADELADTTDLPASAGRLRDVLDADEDTRWFLQQVLLDAPRFRPPYVQSQRLRALPPATPAGDPAPVRADRYVCPHGDYTWYRPDVATPVPGCQTPGHGALVRA